MRLYNISMLLFQFRKCWVIVLICSPIIYYFYLLNVFAVNVPHQDDYSTILRFMNNYFAPSADKLSLLFTQTSTEHRLAFNRLVSLATYYLFDEVNFKFIIFIGNLSLIVIFSYLFKISNLKSKNSLFIVCAYLLFQTEHWESMTWAMAAISNYYVLLFSLLSIYYLHQKSVSGFYLSILFGIIATYTNGNGLFIFYINLVALIVEGISTAHTTDFVPIFPNNFVIYLLFTVVVTFLYFWTYTKTTHQDTIWLIFSNPLFFLKHFLLMLGSGFALDNISIGITVGILALSTTVWLGYKQYFLNNPNLFYFLLFIMSSILVASILRAGGGVLEQALSSRYKLYSVLIIVLLLLSMVEYLEKNNTLNRYLLGILVCLSISFSLYSFDKNNESLINRQKMLTTGIKHFAVQEYTEFATIIHAQRPEKTIPNLQRAINRGYYKIPKQYLPTIELPLK